MKPEPQVFFFTPYKYSGHRSHNLGTFTILVWNKGLVLGLGLGLKMRYSPYVNKGFVYISVSKILNFIRQLFIFS